MEEAKPSKKIEGLLWRGRMNIRKRVFRLMFLGSMLTFVMLLLSDFFSLSAVRRNLEMRSETFAQSVADDLESFSQQQARIHLATIAAWQARHLEHEMQHIGEDVIFLANKMHTLLTLPEYRQPKTLPDSHTQPIYFGQAYLHICDDVRAAGISPEVQKEIALASNIADTLCQIGDKYNSHSSSCQVGSKHGYMLISDEGAHKSHETVPMTKEYMQSYDPRQRPWYKAAVGHSEPIFTDPYYGADGFYEFTCAMPYYDAEGFAGVVGIGNSLVSLSRIVENTKI